MPDFVAAAAVGDSPGLRFGHVVVHDGRGAGLI
jgi:hypothetical protein